MSRIDSLKEYFSSLPEVIRIHELEPYIDSNEKINSKFNEMKKLQKQMVNAKEFNQINQYNIYLNEYNRVKNELLDLPFVEEYLELVEIVDEILVSVSKEIERKIDINR